MTELGYDKKLYILAFDHRGSFQKKFFGIEGEPDPEQTAMIADAKHLVFEGMRAGGGRRRRPVGDGGAGGRAVRLDRSRGGPRAGPATGDARGALGPGAVRLPVRGGASASTSSASTPTSRRCSSATTPTGTPPPTASSARSSSGSPTGCTSASASSCSSCSCPRRPPSWRRWAATPSATTPSCAPS